MPPLATLKPMSQDAESSLASLRNRRNLPSALYRGAAGTYLEISSDMFLGRRCLTFGASRQKDVQLQGDQLSLAQFNLVLGLDDRLRVEDVSKGDIGTSISCLSPNSQQISNPQNAAPLLLTQTTILTCRGSACFQIDLANPSTACRSTIRRGALEDDEQCSDDTAARHPRKRVRRGMGD